MTKLELIEAVKAHAEANYDQGGWDVIVECWSDDEIAETIGRARTVKGALAKFDTVVSVWAERQADAVISAGGPYVVEVEPEPWRPCCSAYNTTCVGHDDGEPETLAPFVPTETPAEYARRAPESTGLNCQAGMHDRCHGGEYVPRSCACWCHPAPSADEIAAAESTEAARQAELVERYAAEAAPVEAEPVAARPVAVEPVAVEPVAARPVAEVHAPGVNLTKHGGPVHAAHRRVYVTYSGANYTSTQPLCMADRPARDWRGEWHLTARPVSCRNCGRIIAKAEAEAAPMNAVIDRIEAEGLSAVAGVPVVPVIPAMPRARTERIAVDIVEKPGRSHASWRIIGACPEWVAPSGGLHVYGGPDAAVRDCETDAIVLRGSSLRDVLAKLAAQTGLVVDMHDEVNDSWESFQPGTPGEGHAVKARAEQNRAAFDRHRYHSHELDGRAVIECDAAEAYEIAADMAGMTPAIPAAVEAETDAAEAWPLRKSDRELLALMAETDNPYAAVDYVPGRWHETNSEGRTRWSFQRFQPAPVGFKSYVRVTAPVTRLLDAGLVEYPSAARRCRVTLTEAGRALVRTFRGEVEADAADAVAEVDAAEAKYQDAAWYDRHRDPLGLVPDHADMIEADHAEAKLIDRDRSGEWLRWGVRVWVELADSEAPESRAITEQTGGLASALGHFRNYSADDTRGFVDLADWPEHSGYFPLADIHRRA